MKQVIDLNGQWELEAGAEWKEIIIPCAVETQLEKRDFYGPFLFRKKFNLDRIEENKSYVLKFEGVSYWCSIRLNLQNAGEHEGVWDGFQVDITRMVCPGENLLEVKVIKPDFDKESPFFFRSVLFGFIPDVMLPFGGIWKGVSLDIGGPCYFAAASPVFDCAGSRIVLNMKAAGMTAQTEKLEVEVQINGPDGAEYFFRNPYEDFMVLPIENVLVWSPEMPRVYCGMVRLYVHGVFSDEWSFTGGFREIGIRDGEILLNGNPFYMRGILHWGYYPERMAPNPSYEEVKGELEKIKELGFNTVKHCLHFPPRYYYELCDEMGIVIWQELPLWLPYRNEYLQKRIFTQYPKMLDYFMQYPSVSLVSIGCELDGTIDGETLNALYHMIKDRDSGMIICDNSGSGECFGGEKHSESDIYDYHFYAELYNLHELIKEFTSSYRKKKPWLFGEFNDYDTYRIVPPYGPDSDVWWLNPDESKNLLRKVHQGFGSDQPIYRQQEILRSYGLKNDQGISKELEDLPELSRLMMQEVRKFILETTRSFPEIKGYNITTVRDVPITTAGIFDDRMESKISPDFMKKINHELAVSFQKDLSRIWEHGADRFLNRDRYNYLEGDTVNGRFVLSNRSQQALAGEYRIVLTEKGRNIQEASGKFFAKPNSTGELANPFMECPRTDKTLCLELCVSLFLPGNTARGTEEEILYKNNWPVWVYPKPAKKEKVYLLDYGNGFQGIEEITQLYPITENSQLSALGKGDILITTVYTEEVKQAAMSGVNVIYSARPGSGLPVVPAPFYREGITKIFPHPVTGQLAHRGYAGIQFFGVASTHVFDKLELEKHIGSYRTLMRRYDARKFTAGEYLLEYQYGKGRVLATTLNFDGGAGEQPDRFGENKLAIRLLCNMIEYLKEPI